MWMEILVQETLELFKIFQCCVLSLFVRSVMYAILYRIFKFVDIINAFHQHDTQIFISFYNNSLFVIYQTL